MKVASGFCHFSSKTATFLQGHFPRKVDATFPPFCHFWEVRKSGDHKFHKFRPLFGPIRRGFSVFRQKKRKFHFFLSHFGYDKKWSYCRSKCRFWQAGGHLLTSIRYSNIGQRGGTATRYSIEDTLETMSSEVEILQAKVKELEAELDKLHSSSDVKPDGEDDDIETKLMSYYSTVLRKPDWKNLSKTWLHLHSINELISFYHLNYSETELCFERQSHGEEGTISRHEFASNLAYSYALQFVNQIYRRKSFEDYDCNNEGEFNEHK